VRESQLTKELLQEMRSQRKQSPRPAKGWDFSLRRGAKAMIQSAYASLAIENPTVTVKEVKETLA
jgi:hypothetical protein